MIHCIEYFKIKKEALVCEKEGMLAENSQRAQGNLSIAYGDTAFFDVADRFERLAQQLENQARGKQPCHHINLSGV